MKEKLLVLGSSFGSIDIINYAKSQGVWTIVTDNLSEDNSCAKKIADEKWMISTADVDTLEKKCREEGVTSVLCGASEFNIDRLLELTARLNLSCYTTAESWRISRDKYDFKKICRRVGAPVATDYFLSDDLTPEEVAKVKFPVMVKPVDCASNRGISYCYNVEDLRNGFKLVRSVSDNPKIVVERMLHGPEWYSSYVISNGKIKLLALNAMYSQPGEPKNCYTITTTVSNHVEHFISEINPHIEQVLKEVGCREGYAWVQAMLDEDGHFYIIEMGYRLDGDMMFIPCRDICGFDTIKMMVDYARGIKTPEGMLPKSQSQAFRKCGCSFMLWTNKEGVVREIKGLDEIAKIPGVEVVCNAQIGDEIQKYHAYGDILFTTDSIEEMCDLIKTINQTVAIINNQGEDVVIKYTDLDFLKQVYYEGLEGK